jgi:hypothetical protein
MRLTAREAIEGNRIGRDKMGRRPFEEMPGFGLFVDTL